MGDSQSSNGEDRPDMAEHFKLSLESYRELFDSMGEAIYIQDMEGKFLEVNQAAVEMDGYEKGYFPGKCAIDLAAREKVDEEASRDAFRRALEGKPQRFEWWGKRKNGEIFPKEVRLTAASYFGQKVVIATARDITDEKKAREKIQKSLREKEVLLSEIHHRVKNNLAIIVGLMELQRHNTENETAQKILSDSQSRINSMALIHEKLYQSKNLMEIHFDNYIEELVKVILDAHVSTDRAKQIHLDIDADPICFTITYAIPCGLLLNEIVTNSIKYAFHDRRHGTIRIRMKREGEKIRFCLSDNGVGLPKKVLDGKFDSLGMQLIQSFAQQIEGELSIYNDNGAHYELVFEAEKRSDTD